VIVYFPNFAPIERLACPDIAANERLVSAANANIGIAQTAYYPTLTLSASAGLVSTSLASLFTWGSRVWSAGPGGFNLFRCPQVRL